MHFFNHDKSFQMNGSYDDHPKHVLSVITPYCFEVMKYPKNYIEYKEKRSNAIDQACANYGKAYDIISFMNPLNCSYLLGHSKLIVKPFMEECAKILATIETFESFTTETMKSCQEVSEWYKPIFKMLDKKMLVSCFLDDVSFWSNKYHFEYDKADLMSQFNDTKKEHLTYLKILHAKNRNN